MRRDIESESRWWTLGGVEVLDVMSAVQALVRQGQIVHIGTDAQKSAKRMEFVTVACVLNPGKGGRVFYTRRFDRKDVSLYEKLSTETWLSLDLAIASGRPQRALSSTRFTGPLGLSSSKTMAMSASGVSACMTTSSTSVSVSTWVF